MTPDILANEKNFLGCLLRSPHEFWKTNDTVSAEMFTQAHHRDIFTAVRDLSESGRQVTTPALLARLPEEFDDFGPAIGVIAALKENASEAGSSIDYSHVIAEQSANKRMRELSKWLDKELGKHRSPEDLASEAVLRFQEIMATASPVRPILLSDATANVLANVKPDTPEASRPGYTTGLAGLDAMTGKLMGGDLIAIMAALGEGKSALLTQIGKHIAQWGPVLACHNEMSVEQNATRAIAGEADMTVRDVREGAFDFAGYERALQAQARLKGLPYHIYFKPRMYLREIKMRALEMKRTVGLCALTVDGSKRLRVDGKFYDAWERKEATTGQLKELALDLNVPLLVAMHRTRKARRSEDPVPHLDDAEFPSIEQDADMVLGVWQEAAWLHMNKPNPKAGGEAMEEWEHKVRRARGIGKMIALKVRSSNPFETREFKWNGPATRFEDL
jgi:replicative DNA helicase